MPVWPITSSEAARRLGLPVSTVTTMITACEIPVMRIGGALCLHEDSFDLLRIKAIPFQARRRPRRKKAAAAVAS